MANKTRQKKLRGPGRADRGAVGGRGAVHGAGTVGDRGAVGGGKTAGGAGLGATAGPRSAVEDPHAVYARTIPQLAHVFGLSVQGIKRNLDNGAPGKTALGYDLRQWIAWRSEAKGAEGRPARMEKLKEEKETAITEEIKMRVAKLRGELISREKAEAARVGVLQLARSFMDRAVVELPTKLVGQTVTKARRIIRDWFDAALRKVTEQSEKSSGNGAKSE